MPCIIFFTAGRFTYTFCGRRCVMRQPTRVPAGVTVVTAATITTSIPMDIATVTVITIALTIAMFPTITSLPIFRILTTTVDGQNPALPVIRNIP